MENNWVIIFSTADELLIEMARQLLEEHLIDSVVVNKKDRAYLIGDLELYVNRDNVIIGKSLLKDLTGE
jgi:hypothetical protein